MEVCVGSFMLAFVVAILMKDALMFLSIKLTNGNVDSFFKIYLVYNAILILSLFPLLMIVGRGVC